MDSTTQEKEAFNWGIVGVDLGSIKVPCRDPNNTAASSEQSPQSFAVPSDIQLAGVHLDPIDPIDPSKEPISLFDCVHEAFVSTSDAEADGLGPYLSSEITPSDGASLFGRARQPFDVEQAQLPYSWMIQNPGQIPESLCSNSPPPQHINRKPRHRSPIKVDGETQMELQLKQGHLNPFQYFFRATAFLCIMDLNSQGLIHPTILAIIVGALFDGEARFLDVFNRFFMPSGFCIEPTAPCDVMHESLLHLASDLDAHATHTCHPQFIMLSKVLHQLALQQASGGADVAEVVGKLVCSSTGREFKPEPSTYAIFRGPKLSRRFLGRFGEWWPFEDLPWQEADLWDLWDLYGTSGAGEGESGGTLDPRLLVVRGIHRAWA